MNIKQTLGVVVFLIVIAALAAGLSFFSKAPSESVARTSPILKASITTEGQYEYIENKDYYTVDVSFPAEVPLSASASAKAELTMEQALADAIAQFKADGRFDSLTAEDIQIQGLGPNRKYAYGATYEMHQGSSTVSYVFTVYADTLGAHPNTFYRTFTFDPQGNELSLADLFKPGSDYLQKLSKLAYAGVVQQLRDKMEVDPQDPMLETVRIGTSPTPESLQFFYIDGTTFGLLFPPYQVAAYAAGSFDVKIPLSTLSDILK